ncbi:MAG: hypothetical protein AAF960_06060 [Bacteroidota bacterium]
MIAFDDNGFVKPYSIIEMSIGDFTTYFVQELEDRSQRIKLFNGSSANIQKVSFN